MCIGIVVRLGTGKGTGQGTGQGSGTAQGKRTGTQKWQYVADCGDGWRCVCLGPRPSKGPGAPAGVYVEIWAEPGSCDCEKPGDPCTCEMHRRAWQDSPPHGRRASRW